MTHTYSPERIRNMSDDELNTILQQARAAIVRRDIGQAGVYRAADLSTRITREQERRAGTNPWNR